MSSCFSYGLTAGQPIRELTIQHGTPEFWQGLPVLVIVLLGGSTTNAIWCIVVNLRNQTLSEYFEFSNLRSNYSWCALAGTIWYLQFFFYSIGEIQMGTYRFSSWTLHMASIMIFGSVWGLALREWKGAGPRTMRLLALSLAVLVASTVVVGYGNYLGSALPPPAAGRDDATKVQYLLVPAGGAVLH
jgi:L-rhamnose-H+ transport protein